MDTVKKQLTEIIASLEVARANLELQEANLRQAEVDFKRAESLFKKEVIPKQQYDKAKTNYDVAVAQVKAAQDRIKQLEASLETQKALIKQTESGLTSAAGADSTERGHSQRGRTEPELYKDLCTVRMVTSQSELWRSEIRFKPDNPSWPLSLFPGRYLDHCQL